MPKYNVEMLCVQFFEHTWQENVKCVIEIMRTKEHESLWKEYVRTGNVFSEWVKGNDIADVYDKVKRKLRRLEREMDWERME
jgi:hypothetical protein